jgi:hypothetical protein
MQQNHPLPRAQNKETPPLRNQAISSGVTVAVDVASASTAISLSVSGGMASATIAHATVLFLLWLLVLVAFFLLVFLGTFHVVPLASKEAGRGKKSGKNHKAQGKGSKGRSGGSGKPSSLHLLLSGIASGWDGAIESDFSGLLPLTSTMPSTHTQYDKLFY